MVPNQGYAALLAAGPICGGPHWLRTASSQKAAILLTMWVIYAYRDLWPLATFTLIPTDATEGNLLWVKISILTTAAIILPLLSPRSPPSHVPGRDAVRPEETASILSLVTFSWLNPLINHAQKARHVYLEELPPLAEYNSIEHLVDISYKYVDPMQTQVGRQKGKNVAWGLVWLFRRDWLVMGVMVVIASGSSFLVPLGLKHILAYVEHGAAGEAVRPWFWIAALLFGSMGVSLAMQYYHYVSTQVVARTQAILTQLMFDHSLRMRAKVSSAAGKQTSSTSDMPAINNLVTTDLTNFTNASTFVLLVLLETPIQIVLSVYFLYEILGWSTFVGIAVLVALLPIPEQLNNRMRVYQKGKAVESDKRVKLVTQMLKNIRTVKLLGWEPEQASKIEDARKSELREARKVTITLIWMDFIKTFVPLVVMLATYATYTLLMHEDLSASIVFSSIALFEILRSQLGLFIWRRPILLQGWVSLTRINRLFQESQVLDEFNPNKRAALPPRAESDTIAIRNARFTWTDNGSADLTLNDHVFSLKIDRELRFEKGGVHLIHGPTACGKTSLLMGLLGEMHYIPTSGDSYVSLPRDANGGVAYVAQEAWILQGTVRDNIVFGASFNAERYQKVLRECALMTDVQQWANGDDTVVGERGTALSGGQKARIALARAVYSSCQTLLIDDVLAALDNTTVRHIVTRCLNGELLHDRTVLLVSNNINAVLPVAKRVVEMGPGGTIVRNEQPTDEERASYGYDLIDPVEELPLQGPRQAAPEPTKLSESSKPAKAEEIKEGHIGWDPLILLFGNMSAHPVVYWIVFLAALLLSGLAVNAQFWLLGDWAKQYGKEPSSKVSVPLFLGIYSALLLGATVSDFAARSMHMTGSLRACAVIHKKLMESVLGTTLRWLETTPTSRVIARCTEDIGAIDGQIINFLFALLQLTAFLVLRLVMVMIVAPVFSVGVAIVAIVSGLYTRMYMRAQLPVKREQSNTRAPLIGHLNSTISGLVSIRAYGVQDRFRHDMYTRIDRWTRASNAFFNLNRWVIVRADMIGTLFTVSLAIYLTYFAQLDASNIGFSLSMAIAFSSKVYEWVRTFNAFEVAERIEQYLEIEREDVLMGTTGVAVEGCWPQSGDLRVVNLHASYDEYENTSEVLKGLSFTVRSGERIGIVGRTGSGKSTLTVALLRCIFTNVPPNVPTKFASEGQVLYSGKSIGSISLPTLRKSITIIPQNPELFAGTIRQNLDPFSQYDTDELETALLSAQGLDTETGHLVEDRIHLNKTISGDGDLSAGERQIVALARAIVRKSKLLIMDEATSSIDHACDARIQNALRKHLDAGVTVLTVAHRLPTIQDYDRVMVLDDGKMVEFDSLRTLLGNADSYFRELVDAAPKEEKESLYAAVGISPTSIPEERSLVSFPP
ncbi:P-loop containing nucleoside triphosphate hydrolase protein [Daedaleopsis nitida]|nr:P-loop containing nucleoside triphosphate hydrolase protein [Daedaleopsis nitida]